MQQPKHEFNISGIHGYNHNYYIGDEFGRFFITLVKFRELKNYRIFTPCNLIFITGVNLLWT